MLTPAPKIGESDLESVSSLHHTARGEACTFGDDYNEFGYFISDLAPIARDERPES